MITICCTVKLLKRTGFTPVSTAPKPTTALGNWYANLLYINRLQFLLFTSEKIRLAVVTPAKEARALPDHLRNHLSLLLATLGFPLGWVDAEVREMTDVTIAKTNSRSILATMTEYTFQTESYFLSEGIVDWLGASLFLNQSLVGPLHYQTPKEVSYKLMQQHYGSG